MSDLANRLHCGNSECKCTRNEAAERIEQLEAQNKALLDAALTADSAICLIWASEHASLLDSTQDKLRAAIALATKDSK